MAVVLQSAVRKSALPCAHFTAILDVDSGTRTVTLDITVADIGGPVTDDDLRSMLKIWARYQVSHGKTLPQLVGGTIFTELP